MKNYLCSKFTYIIFKHNERLGYIIYTWTLKFVNFNNNFFKNYINDNFYKYHFENITIY